jgi:biopolymer transport protein ExbB
MSGNTLNDSLFALAQSGHTVTLWLLILLSILSVAFIIERYFFLRGIEQLNAASQKQVHEILQSNTLNEIEDLSKDKSSFIGKSISYGVRHIKAHGAQGLEEIFNSYSLIERPRLEKHLNFLATVGSNAPFIGLLGTVFGIMDAFRGLATSQGEMTAVMLGISHALIATAVGLLVAIPAVIAYNFYQRKVKQLMLSLESARDLCLAYAKTLKGA